MLETSEANTRRLFSRARIMWIMNPQKLAPYVASLNGGGTLSS
jgi:hypothetical protein